VVEHVPAGHVWVTVMTGSRGVLRSRQSRQVDIREGETARAEFVLREILVSGHVTRSGAPAASVRLEFFPRQGLKTIMFSSAGMGSVETAPSSPQLLAGVTREDGSYELLVDEPGTYWVNASTGDGRTNLPGREVSIPDIDAYVVDLAFNGVPVSGIVVDRENEQPIARASVSASPRDRSARGRGGSAMTGADGRFVLELEPDEYRVEARAEGHGPDKTDLTVSSGGGATDLRLTLPRGGSIAGRVVDTAGRPVGGVWIGATTSEGDEPYMMPDRTLPDGSFQITGLASGTHTVLAQTETGAFGLRAGVRPGQQDVVLTVRPGGRVRVLVRGPEGAPVEGAVARASRVDGAAVTTMVSPMTGADGIGEIVAPAGEVELRVRKDKLEARVTVSVPPGATVPAEITLSEARPGQR
jgi:hypothetical protein